MATVSASVIGNGTKVNNAGGLPGIVGFYVIPSTGRIVSMTDWTEDVREIRTFTGGSPDNNPSVSLHSDIVNGGRGICSDGTYVYAASRFGSQQGILRYNLSDLSISPFSGGDTPSSTGPQQTCWRLINSFYGFLGEMTIDLVNNLLYVIDNQDTTDASSSTLAQQYDDHANIQSTVIRCYSLPLLTAVGTPWTCPAARSISYDGSHLWILQQTADSPAACTISRWTTAGVQGTSLGNAVPDAISVYADTVNNRLLICDQGSDQNIKVYNNLTTPAAGTAIGTVGGMQGNNGSVAPLHFVDPRFASTDSAGNVYVVSGPYSGWAADGVNSGVSGHGKGTYMECYNSSGVRQWYYMVKNYSTVAFLDETTGTDAYDDQWHYTVNLSTGAWSPAGYTQNRFTYARDTRYQNNGTGFNNARGVIRYLGGHKFKFFLQGEFDPGASDGGSIAIYTNPTGDAWVPCGALFAGSPTFCGASGITSSIGECIWTDANNDGQINTDAYPGAGWSTPATTGNSSKVRLNYLDAIGNIWQVQPTAIRRFRYQGLDANNHPIYNYANVDTYSIPAITGDSWATPQGISACAYDTVNDTLYVIGYTTNHGPPTGDSNSKFAGTVIAKYTHWTTTPVLAWSTFLVNYAQLANNSDSHKSIALDWAGSYVFVGYFTELGGTQGHDIEVYDIATGTLQFNIEPANFSTIAGLGGNLDITNGMNWHSLGGNYYGLVEDDGQNRTIVYTVNPGGGNASGSGALSLSASATPASNPVAVLALTASAGVALLGSGNASLNLVGALLGVQRTTIGYGVPGRATKLLVPGVGTLLKPGSQVATGGTLLSLTASSTSAKANASAPALLSLSGATTSATIFTSANASLGLLGAITPGVPDSGTSVLVLTATAAEQGSVTAPGSLSLSATASGSTTAPGILTLLAAATDVAGPSATAALTLTSAGSYFISSTALLTFAALAQNVVSLLPALLTLIATALESITTTAQLSLSSSGTDVGTINFSSALMDLEGTALANLPGGAAGAIGVSVTAPASGSNSGTETMTLTAAAKATPTPTAPATLNLVGQAVPASIGTAPGIVSLLGSFPGAAGAISSGALSLTSTASIITGSNLPAIIGLMATANGKVNAATPAVLVLTATANDSGRPTLSANLALTTQAAQSTRTSAPAFLVLITTGIGQAAIGTVAASGVAFMDLEATALASPAVIFSVPQRLAQVQLPYLI